MKKAALIGLGLYILPAVVFAQELGPIKNLIDSVGDIVAALIPITIGLAVLFFFWGLVQYMRSAGSEEAKKKGKEIMIWGLVALFVMISVYGIIELAQDALGIDAETDIRTPDFPGPSR